MTINDRKGKQKIQTSKFYLSGLGNTVEKLYEHNCSANKHVSRLEILHIYMQISPRQAILV